MSTPIGRSKNLTARGLKATLDIALAAGDLYEGEFVYARDENIYYQVENGNLVKVGVEEASFDNLPYVRYNGSWLDLQSALDVIAGIATIIDGGNVDQQLSFTSTTKTYDGGNIDSATSVAIDSEVLEGGFAESAGDVVLDGGLATV